jgi:hypothetical protein
MTAGIRAASRVAPLLLVLGATAAGKTAGPLRTFDSDAAGRPPAGFLFHGPRDAPAAKWTVEREGDNGFLVHAGKPSVPAGFSVAILESPSAPGAAYVSARTRIAGGSGSTGILWRVQDPDNYYLARLDLARQNIGLYRVVKGNRARIDGEDDLELDPAAWHTLKIVQEDETIRVYLGGIRVLRVRDRTFTRPGSVGLWCTADAVANFDDLRIGLGDDHEGARRRR